MMPRTKVHGLAHHQLIILGLGIPSLAVGTGLIFANKVIHEASHFTTWHAVFGLLACGWLVIQVLLRGLSAWEGGAAFGGRESKESMAVSSGEWVRAVAAVFDDGCNWRQLLSVDIEYSGIRSKIACVYDCTEIYQTLTHVLHTVSSEPLFASSPPRYEETGPGL